METLQPYISLFVQIPIVFIFVWFSINMLDKFLRALEKRDEQLAKRDEQFQVFLEQQRKSSFDAMGHMTGRFADEIKALGKDIAELRGKIK